MENSKKVLVIEDSEITALIVKRVLQSHGFEVKVSLDGLDFKQNLNDYRPDLIISDYYLPNKNGLELYQTSRTKTGSKTPFILMSELRFILENIEKEDLGIDAFFSKPLNFTTLVDEANRLTNSIN